MKLLDFRRRRSLHLSYCRSVGARLPKCQPFRVTTNGDLATLVYFNGTNGCLPCCLISGSDGNLYGATSAGGSNYVIMDGFGTLFKVTTNGEFTTLVFFNGTNGSGPSFLVQGNDGSLYGVTATGGANKGRYIYGDDGLGTVFKSTATGDLVTLFSFNGTNGYDPAGLTQGNDGRLYGVACYGGASFAGSPPYGHGTIFGMTTNGVLDMCISCDGTNIARPYGKLAKGDNGNLYGTTEDSGDGSGGVVFRLVPTPFITGITASNGAVTLTWNSFTNGSIAWNTNPL